MIDGSTGQVGLSKVISEFFNDFRIWCFYQQKHRRSVQSPRGKPIGQLLASVVNGYLDNGDWLGALDILSSPHLASLFPGVDLIGRLIDCCYGVGDEMASTQAFYYLKGMFEGQRCWEVVGEVVQAFGVDAKKEAGWPSLVHVMQSGGSGEAA